VSQRDGDSLYCEGCNVWLPIQTRTDFGRPGPRSASEFVKKVFGDYVDPKRVLCHEVSRFEGVGQGLIGGRQRYYLCGPVRDESEQERLVRWLGGAK